MRCFQCHAVFSSNEVLEYFPHGDSLAYDPVRGRLWLICPGCKRWSLVPIESRWEALEELETRIPDHARLLAQTDNIALLEVSGLRVVRVGRANLHEEAWWRYGRELVSRYARYERSARRGELFDLAARLADRLSAFRVAHRPVWPPEELSLEDPWLAHARQRRFGLHAWRGEARCTCGASLKELLWTNRERWRIELAPGTAEYRLRLPCDRCGRRLVDPGLLVIDGLEAAHVIRRILAYQNFAGATEKQIGYAMRMIDQAGGPERAVRKVSERHTSLRRMITTERFALEIALHEENERQLAVLEAGALEARWKEEEEIASIIDGELTPVPFLSELLRQKR